MSFVSIAAVVSAGAAAAGAGISAYGAVQSADAQSKQYQYKAGVATLNSQIALQNRDLALASGQTEEQQYGMQAAQRMGAIRAGAGASGIDVGSGSKAAVQSSQQYVTGIDQTTIYNNAARKAYGYEVESAEDIAEVGADTAAASNAKQAGDISAAASLVSGAGSVASKWTQGSSGGLFGGGGMTSSGGGSSSGSIAPMGG
jgi:uncharacterized membrane protein YgcG